MKLSDRTDQARGLVRTHLWLVALATCMSVVAVAAAVAAKPVTYTATAEVVVSPVKTENSNTLEPDMGTEKAIAESGVVVNRGAIALGTDPVRVRRNLSVSVVLDSWVLHVSYTASTPETAFNGAGVLASAYVDYRNEKGGIYTATLVTAPSVPATGSRGSLPIYLLLGLVAGLTVGVTAAWLWDRVADRFRSAGELRQLTGRPILARMRRWQTSRGLLPPEGPARECFAFVAARLASMIGQGRGKIVVVASPRAGAGTTTVACGTAVALAEQGKSVVLIGASPEGLRPEQVLGVPASPGLSQLLSGDCHQEMALHPTGVRHLSVIPTGGERGVGLELEGLHLVLRRLEKRAFVVIDAPPMLTSADYLLLADVADFVILVGDLRSGTRTDIREAMALFDDVEPTPAAWVANPPAGRRERARVLKRLLVPETTEHADPTLEVVADEDPPVRLVAPRGPARNGHRVDDRVKQAVDVRRRPGTQPPDVPRKGTPPRDGVRPARESGAAARRR